MGCLFPWMQDKKSGVSAGFMLLLTREQHCECGGVSQNTRLKSFGQRVSLLMFKPTLSQSDN